MRIFGNPALHSLDRQFLGYHTIIAFLKELIDDIFFNSLGAISQILGPKQAILSNPL